MDNDKFCDLRHKADREYLDKCIEVLETRLKSNDQAVQVATKEADKQYQHLNNLRDTMLLSEVYDADNKAIKEKIEALTRLVYIRVGIILAVQAVLYFIK